MIDVILSNMGTYFPEINKALGAGLPVFARMLAFVRYAPGFDRKEVPVIVKIAMALIMTVVMVSIMDVKPPPAGTSLVMVLLVNVLCGALLGFVANCIVMVVEAGGDMINMQMGLQSAQVMDPTSGHQTSVMGRYFSLLGVILFINLGGFYWIFNALLRSFTIFPVWSMTFPLEQLVNMTYLIEITSNILYVGLQIASPILIATLGQDIILGIISRTAPQVNVFQLSFLFKPVFGATILLFIMGKLVGVINDYFLSFARIF